MKEDEIAELALKCFDGDQEKALALLTLLKISLQNDCDLPDVEMVLPEEPCEYRDKYGKCWLDMPDSLRECSIPCTKLENNI
jgi:hypothetical protein